MTKPLNLKSEHLYRRPGNIDMNKFRQDIVTYEL